jgi:hypothetical protein
MEYKNYHIFCAIFLPMTAKLDARFKVYSERFKQYIVINCSTLDEITGEYSYVLKIAKHLETLGYNILGIGGGDDCNYVISDTFEPLKK